jgi:hypothetical protein
MESRAEFIRRRLNEFYNGSVPDYIVDAGKTHITVRVKDNLFVEREYVITTCALQEYLNSESDCQGDENLAGITGDPHFIYNLALECLRWFRFINHEEFR